jgi:dephospho-CoA kinase
MVFQNCLKNITPPGNVVIDGLYSWAEYKILKEKFNNTMKVVCIHAAPDIRYKRLSRTG